MTSGVDISDLKITTLADVEAERIEWLWMGYLPRGKLVVFDGDPELGKSTLALTFAAAVTTEYETEDGMMGGLWPDGTRCQHSGHVVLLSAEDGLADTVRPRIDAAGGNPAKVHSIDAALVIGETGEHIERAITLADVDRLDRAIRHFHAQLLIVDVLMAYMPEARDSHRDQDVRSIFAPLSRVAAETGCTILVLRHLNKAKGGNPLYRGGGSIAIVGAARVGLLVAKCPTDDDDTLCAFAVQKNNLSAKPQTLTYRIVECDNGAGKVQWIGSTDKPIRELLADVERDCDYSDGDNGADGVYTIAHECELWLRDFLTDKSARRSAVVAEGTAKPPKGPGFSLSAINRTASKLKVVIKDSETFPRFTWWSLPDHSHLNLADAPIGHEMTEITEITETTGPDQQKRKGNTERKPQSSQSSQPHGCSTPPAIPDPPGGITPSTPGMTDRVAAALALAAQQHTQQHTQEGEQIA
ncbi:AAA family ATPase [Mycobacterium kansasii]|uniref:AAA family ATPase n=1 Tax=Mycobacterium kansasii TaxID=1768 RepID=UPI003A85B238